ncbi:hypothetical protein SEA_CASSITA_59 [Microbacterium phage Cassita]|nr:hypothetical protein SEA_CASSITA_59 [Microbacterium phage Cassita]
MEVMIDQSGPFDMWFTESHGDAYLVLSYEGTRGEGAIYFEQGELENLKHSIAVWEAQFYG